MLWWMFHILGALSNRVAVCLVSSFRWIAAARPKDMFFTFHREKTTVCCHVCLKPVDSLLLSFLLHCMNKFDCLFFSMNIFNVFSYFSFSPTHISCCYLLVFIVHIRAHPHIHFSTLSSSSGYTNKIIQKKVQSSYCRSDDAMSSSASSIAMALFSAVLLNREVRMQTPKQYPFQKYSCR